MSVAVVDLDGCAKFCTFSDPGIKLFGRDIPLKQELAEEPSTISTVQFSSYQDDQADSVSGTEECKEPMDIIPCQSEGTPCIDIGNTLVAAASLKMGDVIVKCGVITSETMHKAEEVQGSITIEKTPKKPDKLLPCPRCNSLDTKFCYFNNYNVNQPRHFCRKCQRYWTAGGTLRNVPVGAGRRKNKHAALHQKHIIVTDVTPVRTSTADVARHRFSSTSTNPGAALGSFSKPMLNILPLDTQPMPTLESPPSNSAMVAFGQESPLCRSMAATTLGLQETSALQNHGGIRVEPAIPVDVKLNVCGNLTHDPEDCTSSIKNIPVSCQASGPLSNASISVQLQDEQLTNHAVSGSHQMQLGENASSVAHGAVWHPSANMLSKVPFSSATDSLCESENSTALSFSPLPQNILACNGAPGSFWPGFSWQFMNPAMWGAPPLEWMGPWTMPVYPPGAAAAAAAFLPCSSAGSSPQKHQVTERSQPEKCLWVPKTLRIDDPLNAARSSIWTTLGLGDGPLSSPPHGSANAFQVKSDRMDGTENEAVSASRLSNPAALSRSAAFQENS